MSTHLSNLLYIKKHIPVSTKSIKIVAKGTTPLLSKIADRFKAIKQMHDEEFHQEVQTAIPLKNATLTTDPTKVPLPFARLIFQLAKENERLLSVGKKPVNIVESLIKNVRPSKRKYLMAQLIKIQTSDSLELGCDNQEAERILKSTTRLEIIKRLNKQNKKNKRFQRGNKRANMLTLGSKMQPSLDHLCGNNVSEESHNHLQRMSTLNFAKSMCTIWLPQENPLADMITSDSSSYASIISPCKMNHFEVEEDKMPSFSGEEERSNDFKSMMAKRVPKIAQETSKRSLVDMKLKKMESDLSDESGENELFLFKRKDNFPSSTTMTSTVCDKPTKLKVGSMTSLDEIAEEKYPQKKKVITNDLFAQVSRTARRKPGQKNTTQCFLSDKRAEIVDTNNVRSNSHNILVNKMKNSLNSNKCNFKIRKTSNEFQKRRAQSLEKLSKKDEQSPWSLSTKLMTISHKLNDYVDSANQISMDTNTNPRKFLQTKINSTLKPYNQSKYNLKAYNCNKSSIFDDKTYSKAEKPQNFAINCWKKKRRRRNVYQVTEGTKFTKVNVSFKCSNILGYLSIGEKAIMGM